MYTFQVRRPEPQVPGASARNGTWGLSILRKGVILRRREVPAGAAPRTTMEVRVRRQEEKLSLWVPELTPQPLEYRDPMPLPAGQTADAAGTAPRGGFFGVLLPAGVGLVRLQAVRQERPVTSSPVQEGDDLYERGEFKAALESYRKVVTGPGEISQAARYKEGLCLLQLRQQADAMQLFQKVAGGDGQRWPVLADCQLWLLFVSRTDPEREADLDAIAQRIKARGLRSEELAAVISDDLGERILPKAWPAPLAPFLTPPALLLSQALRQVEIRRLLDEGSGDSRFNRHQAEEFLVRGYRLAGQDDEALLLGRRVLQDFPTLDLPASDYALRILEQMTWILRRDGRAEEALAELNGHRPPAQDRMGLAALLVLDRARVLAALPGRRPVAEKELDALLAQASVAYPVAVNAWFLKGYLRQDAGDQTGAAAAWRRGVAAFGSAPADPEPIATAQYLIMVAEVGGPSEAELRTLLGRLTARAATPGSLAESARDLVPPSAFLAMWRTDRGKKFARQFAYRDLSLLEYHRVPLLLLLAEVVHQRALPGKLTADQEEMIWEFVQSAHAALLEGKLRQGEALLLAALWKTKSRLLWPGLKASLDPPVRGPLAYFMGQRLLRDKQPAAAIPFFRDALADAVPGSRLQRLARAALEKKSP
jgi:tetratricopeptide (TPR) repeat protein